MPKEIASKTRYLRNMEYGQQMRLVVENMLHGAEISPQKTASFLLKHVKH